MAVDFRAAVAEYVAMLLFVFLCAGSATGVANGTSQVSRLDCPCHYARTASC
jgi:hypothetical protein